MLCRLAALHDDPDYRGAAVIATGADYRAQASRMLAAQSARVARGARRPPPPPTASRCAICWGTYG